MFWWTGIYTRSSQQCSVRQETTYSLLNNILMDRKLCIRSSQQCSVGQEATYSLHNNGLLDRGFITAWRIVLGSLLRDCCLLFQFNRQFPPVIVSLRRLLSPGMLALLNRNSELTLIRRLIWQFTSRLVIRQWTVRRQLVTRAVTSSPLNKSNHSCI